MPIAEAQFFHRPVVFRAIGFERQAGFEKVIKAQRITAIADKGGVAEMTDSVNG